MCAAGSEDSLGLRHPARCSGSAGGAVGAGGAVSSAARPRDVRPSGGYERADQSRVLGGFDLDPRALTGPRDAFGGTKRGAEARAYPSSGPPPRAVCQTARMITCRSVVLGRQGGLRGRRTRSPRCSAGREAARCTPGLFRSPRRCPGDVPRPPGSPGRPRRRVGFDRARVSGDDDDGDVISGAEAVSLVRQLTLAAWAWSGREISPIPGRDLPIVFVPDRRI